MLIYLLIGVVIMWILELFWDDLELEDPEEEYQLDWDLRIGVFLGWPVIILGAILGIINSNGNDDIGPGFGT